MVGREHQRATVLEALDVAGDHPDLGLLGEVPGEVGEFQVDFVARRGPMREPDAHLLALEHGAALVAGLRDQRDRRPVEIRAELLERVEVRVGAEQPHIAAAHELLEPAFALRALGAGLGETGREDHRELGLAPQHLFEGLLGATGEDDREVDVARDVEHRLETGMPEHGLALRVHGIERRAVLLRPLREFACHRAVRFGGLLRRADQGDGLGVQERADVDVAQVQRASRHVDVERVAIWRGGRRSSGRRRLGHAVTPRGGRASGRKYDGHVRIPASW